MEAAEKAAENATDEVDDFNSDRQDKELALSEFDIRKAVVEPRLNDLSEFLYLLGFVEELELYSQLQIYHLAVVYLSISTVDIGLFNCMNS